MKKPNRYYMTYNEKFYSDALPRTKKRLDNILKIQRQLLEFLMIFLDSVSDTEQTNNFPELLKLIATIKLDIEAINELIPLLYKDFRFQTSVNLLYRSIIGSLITLHYLKGFIDDTDERQMSLGNELNILNKEYLISTNEGLIAENEFNIKSYKKYNQEIIDESSEIELRNLNSGLLNKDGKWKYNSELRATTNPKFLENIKKARMRDKNKECISENEKLRYLNVIESEYYSQLKFLFKYYSQFQHYSPSTIDLINCDLDYTLNTCHHCLNLIITFLRDTLTLFYYNDYQPIFDSFIVVGNSYNELFNTNQS